jgi:hypothetical protein
MQSALERIELPPIAFKVLVRLSERIAAKFLQERRGQHKCHHGLACHACGGHDADVRALVRGFDGLLSDKVGSLKWPAQCRDRLQVAAHDDVLTIGDPAFEPAGAIGGAAKAFLRCIVTYLVLHFGTVGSGAGHPGTDLYALYCLDGHHRAGEPPVELFVPLRVAAQARHDIVRDHLEDSADGIARAQHAVHFLFHSGFGRGIHTAQW